jgi:hypothetical protein
MTERILASVRALIYRDFIRVCRPSPKTTILDVGVSDVINDGANMIERLYPYPENITAVGLGDGANFKAAYPLIRYAQIHREAGLPFADQSFDIATSNAVLEHLGSWEAQFRFTRELCRVAKTVFISVPNRYFPIEHHTGIPVAHYWGATFALACRFLSKESWCDEKNLILMSRTALRQLGGPRAYVDFTGLRLGPFSSNLFLHFPSNG